MRLDGSRAAFGVCGLHAKEHELRALHRAPFGALSLLTDAELDTLEKLCLKAGAGHAGGVRPDVTSRQLPGPSVATRGARPAAGDAGGRVPQRRRAALEPQAI